MRISVGCVYDLLKGGPAYDGSISRQFLRDRNDRLLGIFRVCRPIRTRNLELAYKRVHGRRRFHLGKSRRYKHRSQHNHKQARYPFHHYLVLLDFLAGRAAQYVGRSLFVALIANFAESAGIRRSLLFR